MKWIIFYLTFIGILTSVGQESKDSTPKNPEIITGARTWRMADGSTKRLRFTGFMKNGDFGYFQTGNAAPGGKPLSAFAAEEQRFFAEFRNGRFKLVSTPGLCMNPEFPNGKLPDWMKEDPQFWSGETRTWENSHGKRVEARLVCLTDEDVSLMTGENVGRVAMNDLSAADLKYIVSLKGGIERTYSEKVTLNNYGWDGGNSFKIAITGEQYAALAKRGSQFETALAAAIRHVSSKLNPDKWELASFSETRAPIPGGTHSFDTKPAAPELEESPYLYVAEFYLKKSAETESRQIWPLVTTPKSWPGEPMLRICVMADGSIPEVEPVN